MKTEDAQKLTRDLDNEGLAALHDAVKSEVRNRTPKFDMDSIRHDMSPETRKAAMAAIQDALKEL